MLKENFIYLDLLSGAMKEISIFIRKEDLPKVTEVLRNHNIGGFAFYEVNARGRTKMKEVPEMIRMYMTGRMISPEHEPRIKIETFVPNSIANQIIDDLVKIRSGSEGHGMVFVKEVVNAHEIGSTLNGEAILTAKQ